MEAELDAEPPDLVEPADLARALDADPTARTAYDRLSYTHRRRHILAVDGAKKPETRARRGDQILSTMRAGDPGPAQDYKTDED